MRVIDDVRHRPPGLDDEGVVRDRFTILHDDPHTDDRDGDDLPDWWEDWYFGTLTNNATGDADGDGIDNGGEFNGGTHPVDSNSYLRIADVVSGPVEDTVNIRWEAVPGQRYAVEATTNLGEFPLNWQPVAPTALAVEVRGTLELNDSTATSNTPASYYRLRSTPHHPW